MWGGPCPAGSCGKRGPSLRRGSWPRCATSSRLNRTATEGKSLPPFWSSEKEVGTEDEKWTRLGETRRVAVLECWRGRGSQLIPPVRIARGPNGTKGFVLRRSSKTGEWGERLKALMSRGANVLRSDFAIGLMVTFFGLLFVLRHPWLAASVTVFFALDSLGQSRPELTHKIGFVGELAGGLVLALGVADGSWEVFQLLIQRGFEGILSDDSTGFILAGVVAFSLFTGELLLRNPRDTPAATTLTLGVEEVGKEDGLEDKCLSNGNRYADVNPSGTDTTKTSAAAAEAGRLRRRASALQQNKVWDPGG